MQTIQGNCGWGDGRAITFSERMLPYEVSFYWGYVNPGED